MLQSELAARDASLLLLRAELGKLPPGSATLITSQQQLVAMQAALKGTLQSMQEETMERVKASEPRDCQGDAETAARRATGWRVRICPGPHPRLSSGPWPLCSRRTRHRHRAMSSGLVNYALPVIYSCTVRRSIPGLEEMFRGPHTIARDLAGSRWITHPERGRHARRPGASLAQRGV